MKKGEAMNLTERKRGLQEDLEREKLYYNLKNKRKASRPPKKICSIAAVTFRSQRRSHAGTSAAPCHSSHFMFGLSFFSPDGSQSCKHSAQEFCS